MMAEMLAALLALSIALGSAAAVIQLSATTGSAQAAASKRLIADRKVEAVIDEAVRLHAPASIPLSQTTVSDDVAFACGDRGISLCRLSVVGTESGRKLALTVDGALIQDAPLGQGQVRLVAGLSVSRDSAPRRLMHGLAVLSAEASNKPLASVVLPDELPVGCRYDPGSYACAPGGV